MRQLLFRFALALGVLGSVPAALHAAKTIEIYFIDVEGGQATLIATPSGQAMLIDTGWRGFEDRDVQRILAATRAAKVKKLDYVVITHYHRDHVGGAPHLADKIKIDTFVDHGPNTEDVRNTKEDYADYFKTFEKTQHTVVKPGDTVPMKDLTVQVLSAAGEVLQKPLTGAGQPNPLCTSTPRRDDDATENARSLGVMISFGNFRMLDLGDLTWNKELDLMCPNNPIGTVDLYLSSHHGLNQSGSPALVQAIHPRVAIMNNGATKGGSPDAWQVVKDSPGLEDIWQLHYAMAGGKEHNVADPFIANVDEHCQGEYLKVTADAGGSFTVFNHRNKFQKVYSKGLK